MDRFALFTTPLVALPLPDMEETNRAVAELLLAERQSSPGLQRSNIGGWHSRPDLPRREEPCIKTLLGCIVEATRRVTEMLAQDKGHESVPPVQFELQSWAMVMEDGHYTTMHDHGESHWSTVYYVDAGDTDLPDSPKSGLLAFVDPRHCGRAIPFYDSTSSEFAVRPKTGLLVVFPAWLQHYVHTYRGQRPRISVATNLVVRPHRPE